MYKIGQVVFVLLAKKNQVYPMQVVEVITKRTLQGEEVRYALQAGSDPSTTVMLDQIEGEVFETAEKTRNVLVQRATKQVNALVDAAVKKSEEWYKNIKKTSQPPVKTGPDLPDMTDEVIESRPSRQETQHAAEPMTIMLPDGTMAKVKMPEIS